MVDLDSFYAQQKRNAWLKEQEMICSYCQRPVLITKGKYPDERATIDHLIPLSKGGPDESSNWVVSCKPCNSFKGSSEFHSKMADEYSQIITKLEAENKRLRAVLEFYANHDFKPNQMIGGPYLFLSEQEYHGRAEEALK